MSQATRMLLSSGALFVLAVPVAWLGWPFVVGILCGLGVALIYDWNARHEDPQP